MDEAGAEVRRERRCCRCDRGVVEGIVKGMAGWEGQYWTRMGVARRDETVDVLSPDSSLTKMWWVSSDGEEEVEETEEIEEEREGRILILGCWCVKVMMMMRRRRRMMMMMCSGGLRFSGWWMMLVMWTSLAQGMQLCS